MVPKQKATLYPVLFFVTGLTTQGFRIYAASEHRWTLLCFRTHPFLLPIFYLSSLPGKQNFCTPGGNCFFVDYFPFFPLCPSYSRFGLSRLWNEYISLTCTHMHTYILKLFHVLLKKSFYFLLLRENISQLYLILCDSLKQR